MLGDERADLRSRLGAFAGVDLWDYHFCRRDGAGGIHGRTSLRQLFHGPSGGSLGTLFVSGSNAETDLNRRFTAQENARLALDQLRHDVHNSCAATVTTGASTQSVALTVPGAAPSFTCTASYTWCTIGSGSRYKLYRKAGSSCDATGRLEADYLTSYNLFTAVAASGSSLTKLSIDFPVDVNPGSSPNKYELTDSIGIRNSGRT